MPFSLPVGLVVSAARWAGDLVTKKLFLSTYRRSHEIWVDRHRLGAYWTDCGHGLEYSLYLAQATDPKPRASKIAIRTKGENIRSVSLIFEAESDVARFQEPIRLVDVGTKATVCTLVNIPYQRFIEFHDQAGPRFSWDAFRMRDVRITFQDGCELPSFDTMTSHLSHTWFLNSAWTFKWGHSWNLDAIEWAKTRLAQYWRFGFGMPAVRIYVPYRPEKRITLEGMLVVATRPIVWLMARDFAIDAQFWLALWSGLYVLDNNSELKWRWRQRVKRSDSDSIQ